jgi:tRNA nucleotidyltransferase (CCA-adding enzyme)
MAEAIRARGGRALVVGGFVRNRLLGAPQKDLDVEVYGLSAAELEAVLSEFGAVHAFGRSFPVMRLAGLEADFALAPGPDFAVAARRRDLTINAIGLDPLTQEILDPLGGRGDLTARLLRAADARTFASDPLRGLRVVQLAARFALEPDTELRALCAHLDLSGLPGERVKVELDKLLLQAPQPGHGIELMRSMQMLRFFPELAALEERRGAWAHALRSLDAAAELRAGVDAGEQPAFMYAVLCQNFDAITAARGFLERLRTSNALATQVLGLVENHRAPVQLPREGAPPRAYRELARRLAAAHVSPALLERVARAVCWSEEGDRFLTALSTLEIPDAGPQDAVLGRHLLARGLAPGPEYARILARCRAVQDETGLRDPEAILRRALASPLE